MKRSNLYLTGNYHLQASQFTKFTAFRVFKIWVSLFSAYGEINSTGKYYCTAFVIFEFPYPTSLRSWDSSSNKFQCAALLKLGTH